jgi:aspartyl-tRNA(Asn)/glutamyl-tRNA(Gln) amidotransferase subunit C
MAIDRDEIARIAHLARLEVGDETAAGTAGEISKILDFVGRMNAVDTTGVTPMAHPLDANQRLREDQITESDPSSKAPATSSGALRCARDP